MNHRQKVIHEHAEQIVKAVETITEIISLDDLVYQVRDQEGLGWEGPQVAAYGRALSKLTLAMDAVKEASA